MAGSIDTSRMEELGGPEILGVVVVVWIEGSDISDEIVRAVVGWCCPKLNNDIQLQTHLTALTTCTSRPEIIQKIEMRVRSSCKRCPQHLTILAYVCQLCQSRMCVTCNEVNNFTKCLNCQENSR